MRTRARPPNASERTGHLRRFNRPCGVLSERPHDRVFNTRTDARMPDPEWMTYAQLGERLGVSPEAARQKALRGRWRRQQGNDGRTLVLVEPDACSGPRKPRRRLPVEQVDEHPHGQPDEPRTDARTVDALTAHIETLKGALAKAEAALVERDVDVRRERERVDDLTRELLRVTAEAMAAGAARDNLRVELDAARARPWWKRLVG